MQTYFKKKKEACPQTSPLKPTAHWQIILKGMNEIIQMNTDYALIKKVKNFCEIALINSSVNQSISLCACPFVHLFIFPIIHLSTRLSSIFKVYIHFLIISIRDIETV